MGQLYPDTYPCAPSDAQEQVELLLQTIITKYYELATYIWDHEDIEIWNAKVNRSLLSNTFTFDKEAKILRLDHPSSGDITIFMWVQLRDTLHFMMVNLCESTYVEERHPWYESLEDSDFHVLGFGRLRRIGHPDVITYLEGTKEIDLPNDPEAWELIRDSKLAFNHYLMCRLETSVNEDMKRE